MRPFLLVASVALIAAGCASSPSEAPAPVVRTQIVSRPIPDAALKPCDAPAALPDRSLSARETASYWGKDRNALRACEEKRKAAVEAAGE